MTSTEMTPEQRRQRILDYQKTFLSPEGQNVLANLSRVCYENRTTFFGDNAQMSVFTEGKRWVIIHIREMLHANPDKTEPVTALTEETGNG